MNKRSFFGFLIGTGVLFSASLGHAQVPTFVPIGGVPIPVKHTFQLGGAIVFVQAPPAGWNVSYVLPGATARLELAEQFAGATDVHWNLPGNSTTTSGDAPYLEISGFNAANNGSYSASFTLNGEATGSGFIELKATPFAYATFKNISSRTHISPENPRLIAGFIVGAEGIANGMKKLVLVRAVGPSLGNFNVDNPLPDPELHVYDADGKLVAPIPRWENTQSQARVGWETYEDYLRDLSTHLGAFPVPIPDPATDGPPGEPVYEYHLSPGSYTAVTESSSNASGDVLLEIYESKSLNPFEIFAWPTSDGPPSEDK